MKTWTSVMLSLGLWASLNWSVGANPVASAPSDRCMEMGAWSPSSMKESFWDELEALDFACFQQQTGYTLPESLDQLLNCNLDTKLCKPLALAEPVDATDVLDWSLEACPRRSGSLPSPGVVPPAKSSVQSLSGPAPEITKKPQRGRPRTRTAVRQKKLGIRDLQAKLKEENAILAARQQQHAALVHENAQLKFQLHVRDLSGQQQFWDNYFSDLHVRYPDAQLVQPAQQMMLSAPIWWVYSVAGVPHQLPQ
ncbi:MAG: hypothetical protein OXT67_13515 [Zetaproteobacteria bacterium]|nr:hypothetical protein [Zetaproteobacteria bacterium]